MFRLQRNIRLPIVNVNTALLNVIFIISILVVSLDFRRPMFQIGVPQCSILASLFIVPSVVTNLQVLGPHRVPFLRVKME